MLCILINSSCNECGSNVESLSDQFIWPLSHSEPFGIIINANSDSCINILSICNEHVIIDSAHQNFIQVNSSFVEIIIKTIYISSLDLTLHLIVSSNSELCEIDSSDYFEHIVISSYCNYKVVVNSHYDNMLTTVQSSCILDSQTYSSYVCTISHDGYLYLQKFGNTEQVYIFVYDNMETDVIVFSNMNWKID